MQGSGIFLFHTHTHTNLIKMEMLGNKLFLGLLMALE